MRSLLLSVFAVLVLARVGEAGCGRCGHSASPSAISTVPQSWVVPQTYVVPTQTYLVPTVAQLVVPSGIAQSSIGVDARSLGWTVSYQFASAVQVPMSVPNQQSGLALSQLIRALERAGAFAASNARAHSVTDSSQSAGNPLDLRLTDIERRLHRLGEQVEALADVSKIHQRLLEQHQSQLDQLKGDRVPGLKPEDLPPPAASQKKPTSAGKGETAPAAPAAPADPPVPASPPASPKP